jgi:hypothetical protein
MRRVFYPTVDQQTGVYIPIYDGDEQPASANSLQGVLSAEVEHPMPLGTPVWVTFDYDVDRVLTVTAQPEGQAALIARLDRSYPKTYQQHGLAFDPDAPAWADQLRNLVLQAEKFLHVCADLLTPEAIQQIYGVLDESRTALRYRQHTQGPGLVSVLGRAIFNASAPSMVFVAEHLAHQLDSAGADQLASISRGVREAFRRDDDAEVQRLTAELRRVLDALPSMK